MQSDRVVEGRTEYRERMNAVLSIDPGRTVVLTVDMQRNYLDRDVAMNPIAQDDADRVVGRTKELLDFARQQGLPVIHAYVTRRPIELERGFTASPSKRLKDRQATGRLAPDRLEGSPQAEVPSQLVGPSDIHVTCKKGMDAFLNTDLDSLLQHVFQANAVVLTGINTDTCVFNTAFSASNRGYKPIVISDCVASGRGTDQHRMALELMARSFVWVLSVEEFKQRIGSAVPVGAP